MFVLNLLSFIFKLILEFNIINGFSVLIKKVENLFSSRLYEKFKFSFGCLIQLSQ